MEFVGLEIQCVCVRRVLTYLVHKTGWVFYERLALLIQNVSALHTTNVIQVKSRSRYCLLRRRRSLVARIISNMTSTGLRNSGSGFEFRVVFNLVWLPTMANDSRQSYYFPEVGCFEFSGFPFFSTEPSMFFIYP